MKKSVILSAILGVVFLAGSVLTPVVKAQTSTVEDTLISLTTQLISLVSAINQNYSQQFAAQDARIAALEAKVNGQNLGAVVSPTGPSVNNSAPFNGLSNADQDAIAAMIRTLPDTLELACSRSTTGKVGDQGWAQRRSSERIFRLACEQIGR